MAGRDQMPAGAAPGTRRDVSPMRRTATALLCAIALLIVPATSAAGADGDEISAADVVIVSEKTQLSAADVRAADVTDGPAGRNILESFADSLDVNARPYRVYVFGDQQTVVDAATSLSVFSGRNASGDRVYEVVPFAKPTTLSARAGYAVPPTSAWVYNADGSFGNTYNNWKRTGFWTIMAAWNWKPCSTCTAHQYFRMYAQMQAATVTGQNSPWRRAWIELDNNGSWGGSPYEFELGEPEETVNGQQSVEITVGFGSSLNVTLGAAPLTAGGGTNTSYSGKMSIPTEYWHPVIRSEIASGGVSYCRVSEWNGVKKIATRVGIRQAVNAQLGGWNILFGMQRSYSGCP